MKIVRLGQDVDRTGRLAPEALERTFAACREYASVVREFGVPPERVRFVATSASRDADNREEFVRGVVDILGVEPEVITGDQEAEFSFTGATKELSPGDFAPPYLVVDLGGGSTEFVLGAEEVEAARSVDIGCVRLTERHFVEDGAIIATPDRARTEALRADVEAALDEVERAVPSLAPAPWSAWQERSRRWAPSRWSWRPMTRPAPTTPVSPSPRSATSPPASCPPPTTSARRSPPCTRAASTSSAPARWSSSPSWNAPAPRRWS